MFTEGSEVYFGHYKVTVEEVDEANSRCLVDVKKNDVDWEGYVSFHLLSEEKQDVDQYPFDTSSE